MVAAVTWYIWKARCDTIFKQRRPDFRWIADKAMEHVKDFYSATAERVGKSFYLLNRPPPGYVYIYNAACWDLVKGKGGAGFCIIDSNACVLLAGCCPMQICSKMDAGVKSVLTAISWAQRENFSIQGTLVSCTEVWKAVNGHDNEADWRLQPLIIELRQKLLNSGQQRLDYIPWKWNKIAGSLAGHGINLVSISLFHRGMERPRWLMRMVETAGQLH
ncbi:hypothetical protein J5N97_013858 [Dioscorea zingiberensis]|uniref:RNase H type-1 domain-containing protein n=1 Tax=Dioscorea zingiberensis TaxID=325984 RepID=A0A9D5CSU2_9LILI|nr:hypothetical protein J5N97_013858 [Dioscorea zingiberensis]